MESLLDKFPALFMANIGRQRDNYKTGHRAAIEANSSNQESDHPLQQPSTTTGEPRRSTARWARRRRRQQVAHGPEGEPLPPARAVRVVQASAPGELEHESR